MKNVNLTNHSLFLLAREYRLANVWMYTQELLAMMADRQDNDTGSICGRQNALPLPSFPLLSSKLP